MIQNFDIILMDLGRDRLLVLQTLHNRTIVEDPTCSRCNVYHETSFHVVRECTTSAVIWELFHIDTPPLPNESTQEWLKRNFCSKNQIDEIPCKIMFLALVFEIWKNRNQFMFNCQLPFRPQATMHKAQQLARSVCREWRCRVGIDTAHLRTS